jgi:hypothetical protein
MARLVSKAELARLAGVSRAAISKASGKQLAPALVGDRVDLDHVATKRYLAGRDEAQTDRDESDAGPTRAPTALPQDSGESAEDVESFLDLTLRQITDRFPTETQFKDYLDARKKIADIREKELKNEETEGLLIPREGVKQHVFSALNEANIRLVRDVPKSIANRAIAAVKSGSSVEEVERMVRDSIASVLKTLKKRSTDVLRDGL